MVKSLTAEEIEGNRLIAIWMGAKIGNPVGRTEVLINVPDFYSDRTTSTHATKDLQYHKRWDWLMSVVDKIEAIHHVYEGDYINVRISQGYVQIEGTRTRIFRNTSIEGSKIRATWLAIVDFIKWYNSKPA